MSDTCASALTRRRRLFITASLLGAARAAGGLRTAHAAPPERHDPPAGQCLHGRCGDGRWLVREAAVAFGTTVSVAAVHAERERAAAGARGAIDAMLQVDRLMSLHRPDSQVSRLNRDGALARPDAQLLRVLSFAQELARQSGGAFDVTMQPLWSLYAAARAQRRLPSAAEIAQARAQVGWRDLRVGHDRIAFARPGMALTVNGVAQGHAADAALAALAAAGVHDALIDGGEFGALGSRQPARPWTVGIAHPRRQAEPIATVVLDGRFLSTSGDYATAFSDDFRHHHIVDPRVGRSADVFSSVTVAARSGLQADGLSTALMAMGAADGERLLARVAGGDALWIDKRAALRASAGMPAGACVGGS